MNDRPVHLVAGILDPTIEDDRVFLTAARIAAAAGGVLHTVHASEEREESISSPAPSGAERVLDGDRHARTRPDVRRHNRRGDAAEEILRIAGEVRAGIIVVGPSRRGSLAGAVLGTTTQRVLRAANVPVLVCRTDADPVRRRILLTTDLTAESRRITAAAADLLPLLGATSDSEIRILLVGGDEVLLPPPVRRGPLLEHAETQLGAYLRGEPLGGRFQLEPRVRLGLAGREIVEEAADWGADLVIVGTRGRTGGERLLLGSVAEAVVTRAPCDVLVIPPTAGSAHGHDPEEPLRRRAGHSTED